MVKTVSTTRRNSIQSNTESHKLSSLLKATCSLPDTARGEDTVQLCTFWITVDKVNSPSQGIWSSQGDRNHNPIQSRQIYNPVGLSQNILGCLIYFPYFFCIAKLNSAYFHRNKKVIQLEKKGNPNLKIGHPLKKTQKTRNQYLSWLHQ